jgi:hypothetical protein
MYWGVGSQWSRPQVGTQLLAQLVDGSLAVNEAWGDHEVIDLFMLQQTIHIGFVVRTAADHCEALKAWRLVVPHNHCVVRMMEYPAGGSTLGLAAGGIIANSLGLPGMQVSLPKDSIRAFSRDRSVWVDFDMEDQLLFDVQGILKYKRVGELLNLLEQHVNGFDVTNVPPAWTQEPRFERLGTLTSTACSNDLIRHLSGLLTKGALTPSATSQILRYGLVPSGLDPNEQLSLIKCPVIVLELTKNFPANMTNTLASRQPCVKALANAWTWHGGAALPDWVFTG